MKKWNTPMVESVNLASTAKDFAGDSFDGNFDGTPASLMAGNVLENKNNSNTQYTVSASPFSRPQ